jgi:hypothetical protein
MAERLLPLLGFHRHSSMVLHLSRGLRRLRLALVHGVHHLHIDRRCSAFYRCTISYVDIRGRGVR